MKILVTGAHFTPAVAVILELKKYPNTSIIYAGRSTTLEGDLSRSVESQILPTLGVKFIPIITGRLQRSFTIYTIPSLFKIPIGLLQSLIIILSHKPDVILSFGGYVAVPVVIMGWLFSIPILVHEQTLVSGLASRISSYFANKIALSFKQADRLDKKTIVTGNPIREEVLNPGKFINSEYRKMFTAAKGENLPIILITGGNQGSHILNIKVEEILDKLTKISFIIHVSGDSKFHDFERLRIRQNSHYLIKKWIGAEWGAILSKVDLVVSRAGINTLTELAYFGKPALVIPIPYHILDEQNINAKFFKELDQVEILSQSKLSGNTLLKNVRRMLNDLNSLNQKAKKAKKVVTVDAAERLALETVLLAKNR